MTIGELIDELSNYPSDTKVVFKPSNSYYVEKFSNTLYKGKINSFYGNDYESVVINSDGQAGSI